jgi:hypothetical protein
MIINWIGRVFGWSDPNVRTALTKANGRMLDGATPTPSIVDSDELAAELARTRRYEHDFSIAVLAPRPLQPSPQTEPATQGAPVDATRLPQMVSLLSAVALSEVLRQSDIVCYHAAENRFIIGLTESDGDAAAQALSRIHAHFRKHLRLRVLTGVARFPDDALTLDDLIATAEARATLGTPALAWQRNGHPLGERRVGGATDSITPIGQDRS